jgi:hypothetical protein
MKTRILNKMKKRTKTYLRIQDQKKVNNNSNNIKNNLSKILKPKTSQLLLQLKQMLINKNKNNNSNNHKILIQLKVQTKKINNLLMMNLKKKMKRK